MQKCNNVLINKEMKLQKLTKQVHQIIKPFALSPVLPVVLVKPIPPEFDVMQDLFFLVQSMSSSLSQPYKGKSICFQRQTRNSLICKVRPTFHWMSMPKLGYELILYGIEPFKKFRWQARGRPSKTWFISDCREAWRNY